MCKTSRFAKCSNASNFHPLPITKSMDKKLKTIGIFIDLKKSFDTIDHSLLIKKLNIYGITCGVP